ncbi:MAG: hypothetical protein G3M78_03690 [Candidatus Nitrohelix vancouverensis]|uniref:Uncharacterized protein n=1 Tax=Candidatus Nitrohelix vancouverensis TaxID=2705534 RepID=A0A7T0C114_9BACT|nr:MAG: hypothetical protein G3M78_03690 [Candidatus Nitrohelix vancouverensis]
MSLINKDNLTFMASVEQFFLSVRNSGLTLSATDYELISRWEEREVPLHVLFPAIESGMEEHAMRNPRKGRTLSLTALAPYIEEAIERARY